MKTFNVRSAIKVVAIATFVFGFSGQAMAATEINLGTANSFAVLAGTEVTNVPTSVITGNVGLSPAAGSNYAGITTSQVSGTIYAVDGTGPTGSVNDPSMLTLAQNSLTTAYLNAAGQTPNTTFSAGDNQLGGQTLIPGVYAFGGAATANLIGTLTLNAEGNSNAVFIFQASSSLVTASSSVVQLVNGASACNVFWQVTSSATLGSSSTFVGTIMALTSDTVDTGVTVQGSILASNGAVTLDADTITRPSCIASSGSSSSSSSSSSTTSSTHSTSTPGAPDTGFGVNNSNPILDLMIYVLGAISCFVLAFVIHRQYVKK